MALYPTDETKWMVTEMFTATIEKSFYFPWEYYGRSSSNVAPCQWQKRISSLCESDQECTVFFGRKQQRDILEATIDLNVTTAYILNYLASFELGGMNPAGNSQGTHKAEFMYVPDGLVDARRAPLPIDDVLERHIDRLRVGSWKLEFHRFINNFF